MVGNVFPKQNIETPHILMVIVKMV